MDIGGECAKSGRAYTDAMQRLRAIHGAGSKDQRGPNQVRTCYYYYRVVLFLSSDIVLIV